MQTNTAQKTQHDTFTNTINQAKTIQDASLRLIHTIEETAQLNDKEKQALLGVLYDTYDRLATECANLITSD